MQRHLGRNMLHQAKTGLFHQAAQFVRRSQPTRAHGQQVEMEIGIAQGGLMALTRHRLGQQQGATRGQRAVNGFQQGQHVLVGVVVGNANQGDQVGAGGQLIGQETAARGRRPVGRGRGGDGGRRSRR